MFLQVVDLTLELIVAFDQGVLVDVYHTSTRFQWWILRRQAIFLHEVLALSMGTIFGAPSDPSLKELILLVEMGETLRRAVVVLLLSHVLDELKMHLSLLLVRLHLLTVRQLERLDIGEQVSLSSLIQVHEGVAACRVRQLDSAQDLFQHQHQWDELVRPAHQT